MKRLKFYTIFLFCLSFNSVKSQCNFDKIFPVDFGFSKFKVITSLSNNIDFTINEELNKYNSYPYIKKYDYLKGDSVTKLSLYYNFNESENCLQGFKNQFVFDFVDDKLYQIRINIHFSSKEFDKCLANYNSLISLFKNEFPFYYNTILSKTETKEQIGEGMKFYPTSEKNRNNIKTNHLTIGYVIKYKFESATNLESNNVEEYIIEIDYVNLMNTKLTGKGF